MSVKFPLETDHSLMLQQTHSPHSEGTQRMQRCCSTRSICFQSGGDFRNRRRSQPMKLGPENFGHCSPEWEYRAGSSASNTKSAPASSRVQGGHAEEHVFGLGPLVSTENQFVSVLWTSPGRGTNANEAEVLQLQTR